MQKNGWTDLKIYTSYDVFLRKLSCVKNFNFLMMINSSMH